MYWLSVYFYVTRKSICENVKQKFIIVVKTDTNTSIMNRMTLFLFLSELTTFWVI